MDYIQTHREIYDALAEGYEQRVEILREVTEKAVSLFEDQIKTGKEVLELGPGVGLATQLLTQHGFSPTGVELSPKMAAFSQKRNPSVEILVGDFLEMKFKKQFDGVFAFAFIHLFPKEDAQRVIEKVYRILKPGGIFYVGTTESAESGEGWEAKTDYPGGQKRFRKRWTEKEFTAFLKTGGFRGIAVHKITDPFAKRWMDFVVQKPL